MADEKNIIFRIRTQVADKDQPEQLATGIEQADEAFKGAQRTLDSFDKSVARSTAEWKRNRDAQQQAASAAKGIGVETDRNAAKMNGLAATVGKARGQFQTFVGLGAETKGVLSPLISQTDQLGEQARQTGGDMDFLTKKAKEAATAATNVPTSRAPSSSGVGPQASAQPPTEGLKQGAAEVRTFAAAMVKLGTDGTIAFDELKAAAQRELETLKQVNAEAAKTPAGQAALGQELSKAQTEALDLLVTTKAITAEERKVLEVATQISNAAGKSDAGVKKQGASWVSLRRQMQQAKAELDAMVEASDGRITPELIAAGRKAGELQDRFEDLQQTVQAFNPDRKFQVFANVVQNVAGGFTALQGVMALTGTESEEVGKSLLKVQAALAITQGLQALFGGLRDNLRNLRLLLLSNAGAARVLAVAQTQAGGAATLHGTLTAGLTKALKVAKVAAMELWATLVANPIGIIVAAIGVLAFTVYKLATANEVALVSADKLTAALERVAEARALDRVRDKNEAQLENERRVLEEILALEQQRAAIPSTFTEEQKALANLRIDEQIAEVQRRAARQQALLDESILDREIKQNRSEQAEIEMAIDAAYKKAGLERISLEGKQGKAALDAVQARQQVTENEARSAFQREIVNDKLSKKELEDLDKLEERRDQLLTAEKKSLDEINAVRLKAKNKEIQDQIDITKAAEKEHAARAKLAESQGVANTIAALQKEQAELLRLLNNQLVIGSPEFFEVAAKYIEVTKSIANAQELIKGTDVFPAGSLADLNQELSFLLDLQSRIPEGAEDFDLVRDAVNDLKASIEALNKATAPKDDRAETQRRLTELAEEQRHFNAMADLDEEAAVTRARNTGASEDEIKAIEAKFKAERINAEIDFELRRLEILRASGTATAEEITAQQNKLKELRAKGTLPPVEDTTDDMKELVDRVISASEQIADAAFLAWGAWTEASQQALDAQIAQQQQRVEEARRLAEDGNTILLEEEKKKLSELSKERRKAAQRNIAIAQAEAAANAVVAIARAAAEGGGFLSALTIATTLVALAAGIVQARQTAVDGVPSFRSGGSADWSRAGGYTGYGHPDAVSTVVGHKPYEYHRQEFVMPHEVVGIGRNKQWFEKIMRGRVNMDQMMSRKAFVLVGRGGTDDRQVDRIVDAINSQPKTNVRFDRDGVAVMVKGRIRHKERLDALRK